MKSLIGSLIGLVLSVSVGAESLLEGRVRLESGQPVAGVQVRLFDLTDLRWFVGTTTDETGHFALPLQTLSTARGTALPTDFALGPNYPNPFNPSTLIPYQLPNSMHVRLEVFNLLGQRIATLVDGERAAGFHTATWHAVDASGRAVAAGVYIYRMTVGVESQTGRMVLVDGQAGVSAAGVASVMSGVAGGGSDGAESEVYGLIVSGEGLAPYVDSSFRVEAGMAPVELVVPSGPIRGARPWTTTVPFATCSSSTTTKRVPVPAGRHRRPSQRRLRRRICALMPLRIRRARCAGMRLRGPPTTMSTTSQRWGADGPTSRIGGRGCTTRYTILILGRSIAGPSEPRMAMAALHGSSGRILRPWRQRRTRRRQTWESTGKRRLRRRICALMPLRIRRARCAGMRLRGPLTTMSTTSQRWEADGPTSRIGGRGCTTRYTILILGRSIAGPSEPRMAMAALHGSSGRILRRWTAAEIVATAVRPMGLAKHFQIIHQVSLFQEFLVVQVLGVVVAARYSASTMADL